MEETKSKFDSRKFIAWVVWGFLTLFIDVACVITMILLKQINEVLIGLITSTNGSFFAVTMMYLGMNAGQKIGVAFADSIATKTESSEEK